MASFSPSLSLSLLLRRTFWARRDSLDCENSCENNKNDLNLRPSSLHACSRVNVQLSCCRSPNLKEVGGLQMPGHIRKRRHSQLTSTQVFEPLLLLSSLDLSGNNPKNLHKIFQLLALRARAALRAAASDLGKWETELMTIDEEATARIPRSHISCGQEHFFLFLLFLPDFLPDPSGSSSPAKNRIAKQGGVSCAGVAVNLIF